ncbi:MAG: indole-3-glycerol phosphate synthase TrpC [Microcoleaceae cyanobacterium]
MMQIRRRPPSPPIQVGNLSYEVKIDDAQPQNILEEIVWYKDQEITNLREQIPLIKLKQQVDKAAPAKDFLQALKSSLTKPAIIAEVKKASPSKGVIREDFDPVKIATAYEKGGASCISVLTDKKFFQGSFENLANVRSAVNLPLLCKEFIVYPYQIYLGRASGADAVLLIAAVLPDQDLKYFSKIIKTLGMTALIEVHTLEELDRVLALDDVNLIGINNRNLEDFSVNLETTQQLLKQRQDQIQSRDILVVSESGLFSRQDLDFVKGSGASAVLMGESLIKHDNPETALNLLVK